jgi:group II intron reverse transcriptase/maturase
MVRGVGQLLVVGREGNADGGKPLMHDHRESDDLVVPAKPPNKPQGAEVVEGRGSVEGNAVSDTRPGLGTGQGVSTNLTGVRAKARSDGQLRFTALLHHVTVERLEFAYRALRPNAAAGVDGVTWHAYGEKLQGNLVDLHARVQRGAFRAVPVRRVFIPKPDGRLRPLGVASLEDKIVQRALVEVLNAIYETDFLGFSYGFRPGRSQHDALDALATGIVSRRVNWVLDLDVRDFFGQVDQAWLEKFLEHRIADRRVLRLIQRWLRAGVIEHGEWSSTETGTAQGASISPLLGNVYLHYVFDLWANQWRERHARGHVVITRYADDAVIGFQHRDEAERFLTDLRRRLAQFGLEVAEEKTRLIEFGRFAALNRARRGDPNPETFTFLGFTHICGTSRAGRFQLKRVTSKKKMRVKLKSVKAEMRAKRHLPIPEQGAWLASVLTGHYRYYAVPGNSHALRAYRQAVTQLWIRSLRRRSQRDRLTTARITVLEKRWLPRPQVMHPWPDARFHARTLNRSPVR